MKFGRFMSYYQSNNFIKKFYKNAETWEIVPDRFVFAKNSAQPIFEASNLL